MSVSSRLDRDLTKDDHIVNLKLSKVFGQTIVPFFGLNTDIDIGNVEDIWDVGGIYTGQPPQTAAPEQVEIFSDNANDFNGGTGAAIVGIQGLDSSWNQVTAFVVMNGVTPVSPGTVTSWHRVTGIAVLFAGTSGFNEGTITCRHVTTTANVFASIRPQNNRTQQGVYTVPDNKKLVSITASVQASVPGGGDGSIEVGLLTRSSGTSATYQPIISQTISTRYQARFPIQVTQFPRADLKFQAKNATVDNMIVSVAYHGIMVDQ